MSGFWKCVLYAAALALLAHPLGQAIPGPFDPEKRPFRSRKWEQNGRVYTKLAIDKWKKLVPDMSRILPKLMPPKKMTADYGSRLPRMLQETCVAEFIHVLLSILGFGAVFIVGGAWGWIISIVYFLAGNLPYIIIQRYNRPRLLRLEDGMKKQEGLRQK